MSARASLRLGVDDAAPDGKALLAAAPRGAAPSEAIALPLAKAPDAEKAALREGSRAAAAMPPDKALLVRLSPPPLPPAKRRAVLPAMLAAELPFPLSECVWRFEDAPGGAVLAHVARRADLDARLAALRALGCDPAALVPPGPALWRADCASRPLPADAPRAVFFAGPERTLLAAGRGDALASVAVFDSSDRAAPALRLRLAFGGLPSGLAPLVAGPGAAALAAALPAPLAPVVPQSPEAHLARALAAAPLAGLDLRAGADPHPATERPPRRLLAAASLAVLLSAALAGASAWFDRAVAAEEELREAQRDRAARLSLVAGYPVRTRGESAIAEAREAAAARRDPALFAPDASAAAPAAIAAARAAGVRLAHLAIEDGALSASGTAPDAASAESFAAAARAAGLRAALGDDPKPSSAGVDFFVRPAP